mmetsp:Transcript_13718/g.35012  ORF Transcript_13718/g.35012 Transcript_13718/m.35012 type:complete len:171 (+) Transcript_13718:424-936(+)
MSCWSCKHQFCWICFKKWSGHTSCNAYQERPGMMEERRLLERLAHHFKRYKAHEDSARLAAEAFRRTEAKITELVENQAKMTYIDFDYLNDAVRLVFESRGVLKNSYPVLYFEEARVGAELVQALQAELESAVEELNELVEMPVVMLERETILKSMASVQMRLDSFVDCF